MRNEYLKTLWMLRFSKMKENEDRAAWNYQEILDECLESSGGGDPSVVLLKQLVREERAHAKLAEELARICLRNHPELNAWDRDGEINVPVREVRHGGI